MGKGRAPCCDKSQVKRGPWSPAEDLRLITFIQKHGHDNWRALPKQAGLQRCGKSCRLRWINYLRPDVKRGHFTPEEEEAIIKLHESLGNKWSKIASKFPGRTDNEIKNIWNTHLKKRLSPKEKKKDSITMSSSSSSSSIKSCDDQNIRMSQTSEAKEPTSPTSLSYNSNFTNSQVEVTRGDQEVMGSLFNSRGFEVMNNHEDKHRAFELPLESDLDFWNMLDTLGPSESNESQGPQVEGCQSSNFGHEGFNLETESMKWLRYLENELGLEATATDQTHEFATKDAIDVPQVAEAFDNEALFKQGHDQAASMTYFQSWPSSPFVI